MSKKVKPLVQFLASLRAKLSSRASFWAFKVVYREGGELSISEPMASGVVCDNPKLQRQLNEAVEEIRSELTSDCSFNNFEELCSYLSRKNELSDSRNSQIVPVFLSSGQEILILLVKVCEDSDNGLWEQALGDTYQINVKLVREATKGVIADMGIESLTLLNAED